MGCPKNNILVFRLITALCALAVCICFAIVGSEWYNEDQDTRADGDMISGCYIAAGVFLIIFSIFHLLSGMNLSGPGDDEGTDADFWTKATGCARGLGGWLYNCQMGFFICAAIQLIIIGSTLKDPVLVEEEYDWDSGNYNECPGDGMGCMDMMMDKYGSMAVQSIIAGVMYLCLFILWILFSFIFKQEMLGGFCDLLKRGNILIIVAFLMVGIVHIVIGTVFLEWKDCYEYGWGEGIDECYPSIIDGPDTPDSKGRTSLHWILFAGYLFLFFAWALRTIDAHNLPAGKQMASPRGNQDNDDLRVKS